MDPWKIWAKISLIIYFIMVTLIESVRPCAGRGCPGVVDPKTLATARIEAVKQKILNKLRFDKAPVVTKAKRPVPRMIVENMMYSDESVPSEDYGMEEFYAREGPVAIFAEPGLLPCNGKGASAAHCLTFILPPNLGKKSLESASLNLHIRRSATRQGFVALQIKDRTSDSDHTVVNTEHVKDGWQVISIRDMAQRWFKNSAKSVVIQISCEGCQPDDTSIISTNDERLSPYILIHSENKRTHRNRRGVDCNLNSAHCCRENLYINFTDIGWDSWIIEPRGYFANYCKGQCSNNGIHMPTFAHTTIMQINTQENQSKNRQTEAMSCCAPTRMSGLALLFYDGDGSVHKSILPNMSVDSCGCA